MDNGLSTAPLLYAGIINRPCRLVNPRPCFCNVFVASYAAGASPAPGAGVSVAEAGASVTEAGASVAGAGVSVVSASAAAPGSASADLSLIHILWSRQVDPFDRLLAEFLHKTIIEGPVHLHGGTPIGALFLPCGGKINRHPREPQRLIRQLVQRYGCLLYTSSYWS